MTTVKFLRGYTGLLTGGQYYAPGQVVDLEPNVATALRNKGVVEIESMPASETATPAEEPAPVEAPAPAKPARKTATKRASKKAVKRVANE